jgi:hypothetical protein
MFAIIYPGGNKNPIYPVGQVSFKIFKSFPSKIPLAAS